MRALLMKYKQTNLMLVDYKNENGNASVQQQVFNGAKAQELFSSSSTPTTKQQNSMFSQFNETQEVNRNSTFKENAENTNIENVGKNIDSEAKIISNEVCVANENLNENQKNQLKLFEDSDRQNLNLKKRKAQTTQEVGGNMPFAKKKPANSSELNSTNDETKQKKLGVDSKPIEFKNEIGFSTSSLINNKSPKTTTEQQMSNKHNSFNNNNNNKESSSSLDLKKKSKSLSKVTNTNVLSSSQKTTPVSTNQNSNTHSSNLLKSSSDINKDKFINKDKNMVSNSNKAIGPLKDTKQKANLETAANSLAKKADANFTANVNMKIKPITKDGLKVRISKETPKLPTANNLSNASLLNSVENTKSQVNSHQLNASSISTSSIASNMSAQGGSTSESASSSSLSISNGLTTSQLTTFTKQLSFNESLNSAGGDKTLDISLPKYEPTKSKTDKRSTSNTQFKRSISSAPTTPNYTDNNQMIMSSLSNSLLKNKSITPPTNLDLTSTPIMPANKNKTLPASILPSKMSSSNNSIKSNFKIPKSKLNQDNTDSSSSSNNNQIQRNTNSTNQQGSNLSIKKPDNSHDNSFKSNNSNNSQELNSFLSPPVNRNNNKNSNTDDFNNNTINQKDVNTIATTSINKTVSSSSSNSLQYSSKQSLNSNKTTNQFSSNKQTSLKDKAYTTSTNTSNRTNTSNLSPTSTRPLTPVPPLPPSNNSSLFSQPYNRNNNNRTPLMNNDKNRNPVISSSSALNNHSNAFTAFTSNNTTNSNSHSNQILLTPTSPSNNNEEILTPSSKLSTIIPPDSPSSNVCETTTIPKLIPLERNNDLNNNASENLDQLDEFSSQKRFNCENSPEESSLIIDLVSSNTTPNSLLTPLSERLDKVSAVFANLNDTRGDLHQTNSPISYSKSAYPDVYDNDTENDLKVN